MEQAGSGKARQLLPPFVTQVLPRAFRQRPDLTRIALAKLLYFKVLVDGGEGQNRTVDTTIFSRMLYQLSYLAHVDQGGRRGRFRAQTGDHNNQSTPGAMRGPWCSSSGLNAGIDVEGNTSSRPM